MRDEEKSREQLIQELQELRRQLSSGVEGGAERLPGGAERFFRATIECLPFDYWAIGPDRRFLVQNSFSQGLWGDVTGQDSGDLPLTPEILGYVADRIERCFASGASIDEEVSFRIGKKERHFRSVLAPVGDGREVLAVVGINIELTEKRQAQKQLALSEEKYRHLTEFLPVGVYEFDLNGRFIYVNRAFTVMFGHSREETLRLRVDDVVAAEDRSQTIELLDSLLGGRSVTAERSFLRKDGRKFVGEIHTGPMYRGSEIVGIRGVIMDISDRRKAEEELLRADKLESVGLLSGGIAHDFNNLLTVILGSLNMAELDLPQDGDAVQFITEAIKAALRARQLTQQLLTFARGGVPLKKATSLVGLIEQAARFSFTGSKIQVRHTLPADLWTVDVDEGQITQAINGLATHATQVMPGSGTVEIAARNVQVEDDEPGVLKKGRHVELSFRARGKGISDASRCGEEKGSGLGLAICSAIVRRHQGRFEITIEGSESIVFRLHLPATERRLQENEAIRRRFFGRGRILVMDDDEMIRLVLQSMLVQLGHEVTMTVDGAAAIEQYLAALADRRPFDLVIMDLVVPGGMDGVEAMKRLREIDPQVKAIISSGYATDPVVVDYRQHGFAGYLCKPYRFDELTRTLASVITPS
ncbi:MAG: PAS domain S-box protein [Deltaproteobacteria bacterium]|nr:PAS domain S-box protein [Deltaproteobacteria bacterium]